MVSKPSLLGLPLEVIITIAPENGLKFLGLGRPAYEAVIEEPECIFLDILVDPGQDDVQWVEGWTKNKN